MRSETNHLQQSTTKKSFAFQLEIYLFLLKPSLLRDGIKLICSTQTRPDPWLPFITRQPSIARYQEHFILLPPCQSHREKAGGLSSFPGHRHHHLRGGPGEHKVWSRALNVRLCVAALEGPVSFPLCLYHKVFSDHSCPFCGHLRVNFCCIFIFTHLAFCQ